MVFTFLKDVGKKSRKKYYVTESVTKPKLVTLWSFIEKSLIILYCIGNSYRQRK